MVHDHFIAWTKTGQSSQENRLNVRKNPDLTREWMRRISRLDQEPRTLSSYFLWLRRRQTATSQKKWDIGHCWLELKQKLVSDGTDNQARCSHRGRPVEGGPNGKVMTTLWGLVWHWKHRYFEIEVATFSGCNFWHLRNKVNPFLGLIWPESWKLDLLGIKIWKNRIPDRFLCEKTYHI